MARVGQGGAGESSADSAADGDEVSCELWLQLASVVFPRRRSGVVRSDISAKTSKGASLWGASCGKFPAGFSWGALS